MVGADIAQVVQRPEPALEDLPILNTVFLRDPYLIRHLHYGEELRESAKIPGFDDDPDRQTWSVLLPIVLDEVFLGAPFHPLATFLPLFEVVSCVTPRLAAGEGGVKGVAVKMREGVPLP